MADIHQLDRMCRVCGKKLRKARSNSVVYSCADYKQQLLDTFSISISDDSREIHPSFFCNSCYSATKRHNAASASGIPHQHSIVVFLWEEHKDTDCRVCQHLVTLSQGGRQFKGRKSRGRPTSSSPTAVIRHVQKVASPPFIDSGENVTLCDKLPQSLQCPLCCSFVEQPVELACNNLVCAACCCKWIQHNDAVECPCCHNHTLSIESVKCPSPVVLELIGETRVRCSSCAQATSMAQYTAHKSSHCRQYPSPLELTARDILEKSSSAPTLPVENRVAENLIRRLMSESSDPVIKVPTRGQPISLVQVSTPRVTYENASQRTVHRRVTTMQEVRGALSVDLAEEVRALPKTARQNLLSEASLPVEIPTDHALAMKANLSISWNKLRTLRRWLKVFNVSLASELQQRNRAKEAVGENLAAEMVPFAFTVDNGVEFREVPFVFVPNLIARVADRLNQHYQSQAGLTWHDSTIPSSEVWLKLGGDKGRGSFKFNMQVVNVQHPNSTQNTSLIAVFKAGDSLVNLHTGLDQYKEQVNELQGMKWRDWRVKVYFSGDYEFLCSMYGLSGASGRHNCLWCTICSSDLKTPLQVRGRSPARSLKSLKSDHQEFVNAGSKLKRAKEFNNAIHEPFFDIPLDQVCIPGLHLSLGIFGRLFNLLEEACKELDLELIAKNSQSALGGPTFQLCASLQSEVLQLEERLSREKQEYTLLSQLSTYLTVTVQSADANPTILQLRQETSAAQLRVVQTETEIAQKVKAIKSQTKKCGDGPFLKCLDTALTTLQVAKQAYHGGSFIGNHVHKLVQANNAEVLCSGIITVAENYPELLPKARDVYNKHVKAITLFGKCHNRYNTGVISDEDINTLEKDIVEFLTFYRDNFPNATVLPKMHILEDHVIPWLRQQHIASGLMGEQGAESIHSHVNRLEAQYCGVANPLERLKYVFNMHNVEATPEINDLRPPLRKKKKKTDSI